LAVSAFPRLLLTLGLVLGAISFVRYGFGYCHDLFARLQGRRIAPKIGTAPLLTERTQLQPRRPRRPSLCHPATQGRLPLCYDCRNAGDRWQSRGKFQICLLS
jgi:hypothetical protein